MKNLFTLIFLFPVLAFSQICNPNGNVLIFSNYDGGILNIDVDVNIPNLKIGVVTYEGVTINLSGTYVNNVTAVEYAGYNANHTHCGSVINTSINGAPVGATTNIVLIPAATLTNPNGYSSIICAYSCDNTTSQGGCNTVDQVEDYFLSLFGGALYSHHTQYGCWNTTQLASTSGNCCPSAPLNSTPTSSDPNCNGNCDGTASVIATGGTGPYSYLWSPGGMITSSVSMLCADTYTAVVTDANGDIVSQTIVIVDPAALSATFTSDPDPGDCSGSITVTAGGGNTPYTYQWDVAGGSGTAATATGLCTGSPCVAITDGNSCGETFCDLVGSSVGIAEYNMQLDITIYPNPSNGNSTLMINSDIVQKATLVIHDAQGREIRNEAVLLENEANEISLNLNTKGVYLLSLRTEKGELQRKIIVE